MNWGGNFYTASGIDGRIGRYAKPGGTSLRRLYLSAKNWLGRCCYDPTSVQGLP